MTREGRDGLAWRGGRVLLLRSHHAALQTTDVTACIFATCTHALTTHGFKRELRCVVKPPAGEGHRRHRSWRRVCPSASVRHCIGVSCPRIPPISPKCKQGRLYTLHIPRHIFHLFKTHNACLIRGPRTLPGLAWSASRGGPSKVAPGRPLPLPLVVNSPSRTVIYCKTAKIYR